MAFSVGETLQSDKYRLHALLDQHQWGTTFLATHQSLDQQVVIKTFQAATEGPSRLQLDSYMDYAKKLRRFHHPHLSRVINIFEEAGQACMVSEFIQGRPLTQLIQQHPLDENTALTYIRQVAQGLHALHRHGLLHLNLSPDRILKRQGDGKAVLVGLNSRFASQEAERNANPYLSFEQHQTPAAPNLASEIYSISAILYKLVTGEVPTPACDRAKTPLIQPREHRAELSQTLEAAIMAGMALASSDRPQRMKDWIKLLPQPSKADAKTKLQIPSAWQVKLPALRDEPQTTIQIPSPKKNPSDQRVEAPGHSELDSSVSPQAAHASPVAEPTTIQVEAQRPATAFAAHPIDTLGVTSSVSGSEVSAQMPTNTAPHRSAILPQKKASRFPKWTLFWCALFAACGGLAAGLWFRMQLTRQFAMPPTPIETSPLDQLRTLEKKEEEFLPTQSSIIPEEKNDAAGDDFSAPGDNFSSSSPPESDFTSIDQDTIDSELGERTPAEEWEAPRPWSRREGQDLDLETPISTPTPSSPELSNESDFVELPNSDPYLDPSPSEHDTSSQPIEQPLESEDFEYSPNEPYTDSTGEDSYTSDGGNYNPNSGTL